MCCSSNKPLKIRTRKVRVLKGYKVFRIIGDIMTGPYYKYYYYKKGEPSERINLSVLDDFSSSTYYILYGYHFFPKLDDAIKELNNWPRNDNYKLFSIEVPLGEEYCYSKYNTAVASSIIIKEEIKVYE